MTINLDNVPLCSGHFADDVAGWLKSGDEKCAVCEQAAVVKPRLVKDECGDYDVFLGEEHIGYVRKGGLHSLTYYPWTIGRISFGTRREAVAHLVARHNEKAAV